jgi:glycosyltransferase involved in cell wall biosynthesis
MKILVISNMYPSKNELVYGNFVKDQVEELRKDGHEVDIAVITKRDGNKLEKIWKYVKFWSQYTYLGLFKKYDFIHFHTVFPTTLFYPLLKSAKNPKTFITVHGTDELHYTGIKKKVASFAFGSSEKIIAVSDNLKADLEKVYGLNSQKVISANCGVNREMFVAHHDKQGFRKKLNLDPAKKLVLFLGRTYKEKGVYTFVDVVKKYSKHPDVQFAVVGNGPETEQVVKELKETNATFTYQPSIAKEKVYEWFNAADVFIFPTEKEAFGLVALESVSCHTPVIASNVGGVPEIVRDGKSGYLVPVGDSDAIVEKLEYVLSNPDVYETLQKGCEEVADEFSFENQMKKVKKCYSEL